MWNRGITKQLVILFIKVLWLAVVNVTCIMFSLFLNDLFPGYIEIVIEIVTPVVVTHQVDRT